MTTLASRAPAWSCAALEGLREIHSCPRCAADLEGQRCPRCGADYSGPIGGELWNASLKAVAALEARQSVLERVPSGPPEVPSTSVTATPVRPNVTSAPSRSSATVQSVLAVAGAGLVAVAAIVFTFFNPDLTDSLARGLIVGAVTAGFLAGALALARRGLQFSAEAVGALGMVFLGLDIHALTALAPHNPWAVSAAATLVAGALIAALAMRAGIRVWLWTSLVALAMVPAMIGYAFHDRVLGYLGTAVAAFVLIAWAGRPWRRFGAPLRAERVSLTVLELIALAVALTQGSVFGAFPTSASWASLCLLLGAAAALALLSTRNIARAMWSFLAGAFATTGLALMPIAVLPDSVQSVWWLALIPAAAAAGATATGALVPVPHTVERGFFGGGAITTVAAIAVPPTMAAVLLGAATVLRVDRFAQEETGMAAAVVLGLSALALGLGLFSHLSENRHATSAANPSSPDESRTGEWPTTAVPVRLGTRWIGYVGLWFGALAALTVLSVPGIPLWGRVAIGLVLAGSVSSGLVWVPALRVSSPAVRVPLVVGSHLLVLLSLILSWRDATLAVWSGIVIVALLAVLARTIPARARFLHVGVGYAYALIVFATALSLQGVGGVALLCLTTSAGAVVAIAATFLPVRVHSWYAVLAVTAVPFVLGVAQVVFERSGWTALSTALIFLLALTLMVSRRRGLGTVLRVIAAGLLVPSLAVVIVCLGAQLLSGSGSPVVLPLIAILVALVLPCGPMVRAALAPRIGERDAGRARLAIEASALLTAVIAVVLALVREAAGLSTTFLVLVILGVGGAATAWWGGRRYGWWVAAAAFTGALWCALGIAGVQIIEPYLLPPAVGAALVGAILTSRGSRAVPLTAVGLFAAVVPLTLLVAVTGPPSRAVGLLAASWALVVIGAMLGRGTSLRASRVRPLRPVVFAAVIVAAAAGAVQGVRYGIGADAIDAAMPIVLVCAGFALAGAAPATLAARALRAGAAARTALARTRWLYAPAFVYVAVGVWWAIQRDWFTIWSMWGLSLGFSAALVGIAWAAFRRESGLPPVWFVFGLAFVTAVVAWSPRELRVEWFSLPLGAALLMAGAFAVRSSARSREGAPTAGTSGPRARLESWPCGWRGSWPLLAPGLIVAMSASVAATFTDPLTWRAILVIVLALCATLVGAGRRLAAPFLIGIVVLPVENAIAFLVQIGLGIQSMPWWITLAVVGAVLLIIAVTYERRAGEDAGIAARLRDLG